MPEISPSKFVTTCGWDEIPHLSEQAKKELLDATPPWLRDARTKGEPSMGAGAIYPIPISDIEVDPFPIGKFWKKAYALDVGWNRTAALWGAQDPSTGVIYCYSEHYQGQQLPIVHAAAIRSRGAWIQGAIDPAARGRSQRDGAKLISEYQGEPCNLKLIPAVNEVATGLEQVWQALALGRLKIFKTLQNLKTEYRVYRRDEHGAIVKKNDHLMDCLSADTLVWTDRGKRRIADLVGTEGNVVTIGGRLVPYRDCRMYGRDRDVVRLSFSDGTSIVCTPDHLFLSEGEWVEGRHLSGRVVDTAVSQCIREAACPSQSSPTRSRSSRAIGITSAGSIFRGTAARVRSAFTSLSGSALTVGECRKASTSTIATMFDRTTTSPTSNSRRLPSTSPITSADTRAASRLLHSTLRLLGTAARKVASGIASTMRGVAATICMSMLPWSAISAASNSWGGPTALLGFAPTTARRDSARRAVSTTRSVAASAAAQLSPSTSTRSSRPVASPAEVWCLAISDAGKANVYCLTVPETAAFAVEGGIISHNCLRYLWMTWDKVASLPKVEASAPAFRVADRRAGI